jgi:hypothetical protein
MACQPVRDIGSLAISAHIMEKSVLSKWHTVLMPPGLSKPSSGHVSPSRALFCVVAKTGMFRIWPDSCVC